MKQIDEEAFAEDDQEPSPESNYYGVPQPLREAAYKRIKQFDGKIGVGVCTSNRIDMILEEAKDFYAPKSEVPDAIKDILIPDWHPEAQTIISEHNDHVLEAYRRGKEGR